MYEHQIRLISHLKYFDFRLERWLSGRKHTLGRRANGFNPFRGFESRSLRISGAPDMRMPGALYFVCAYDCNPSAPLAQKG